MWKVVRTLAGLAIAGFAIHFFWVNGWNLGLAKMNEPSAMVVEKANEMIRQHKANEGVPLLEYESSQGDRYATLLLAALYEHGREVPKDPQKALKLYRDLAGAGSSIAMNEIGIMYYCGQVGTLDRLSARQWFARAAAAGNQSALKNQEALEKNHTMNCPAP